MPLKKARERLDALGMSTNPGTTPRKQDVTFSVRAGRKVLQLALFAVAFYFAFIYGMSFQPSASARFWLPDAVLLSALLLTPRREWWVYLLIPVPIRFMVAVPPDLPAWFLLAFYIIDSLKALIGASALLYLNDGTPKLATIRELLQYYLVVVLATPVLSAFAGAITRLSVGDSFWLTWQRWFLGAALTNLILTPLILYWSADGISAIRSANIWRWLEGILLFVTLTLVSYVALSGSIEELGNARVLIYLPFPLLLYAAMRFGPLGVSSAFFIVTSFAIWNADQGRGPFAERTPSGGVLWLQLFFYVMSIPLLCVAILLREKQRREEALRESHNRVEALAGELLNLQEEERRRIAAELHDSLGQNLAIIRNRTDICLRDITDSRVVRQQLKEISQTATEAMDEVYEISHNLRPFELDRLGLVHAIESVVEKLGQTNSIQLVTELDPIDGILSPEAETSVYRIVQEGLNNIIKHSEATKGAVIFSYANDEILIIVADNGKGIENADMNGEGFGLRGIAERARLLGATMSVDSKPGRGTKLIVRLTDLTGVKNDESNDSR